MVDARAGRFRVPGAWLRTECRGSGPLLLMVVGSGDPGRYAGVAERLAGRWTVLSGCLR